MTDIERSLKFYTGLLGMKVLSRQKIEAANGEVVSLSCTEGGPELELNFYEKGSRFDVPYEPGEGLDHLAFSVEDMDGAIKEAAGAGHPVVLEIAGKTSRWVYIKDPDGNYIELVG